MLCLSCVYALYMLYVCSGVLFVCSMYVLCKIYVCSVYALCMFYVCSVDALCIFCVCSMYILCMLFASYAYDLRMFYVSSMCALCMLYASFMYALCKLYVCSMCALCVLCVCCTHTYCMHLPSLLKYYACSTYLCNHPHMVPSPSSQGHTYLVWYRRSSRCAFSPVARFHKDWNSRTIPTIGWLRIFPFLSQYTKFKISIRKCRVLPCFRYAHFCVSVQSGGRPW